MHESNYARAEGLALELELQHKQALEADSGKGRLTLAEQLQLADVYGRLAVADQLAELRADVLAKVYTLQTHGGRSVVDVPLPGQAEGDSPADLAYPAGACVECGTPELLGHKLTCSQAVR